MLCFCKYCNSCEHVIICDYLPSSLDLLIISHQQSWTQITLHEFQGRFHHSLHSLHQLCHRTWLTFIWQQRPYFTRALPDKLFLLLLFSELLSLVLCLYLTVTLELCLLFTGLFPLSTFVHCDMSALFFYPTYPSLLLLSLFTINRCKKGEKQMPLSY